MNFELDEDNTEFDRRGARFVHDPAGGRWFLTVPDEDASSPESIHEFCTDEQAGAELAAMAPEEIKERLLSARGLGLPSFAIREVSEGSWNSKCERWTRSGPLPACLAKLLRGG